MDCIFIPIKKFTAWFYRSENLTPTETEPLISEYHNLDKSNPLVR